MERTRRIFNGRLSEVFGEDALALDKFARTIGYRRNAEETWKMMDPEEKSYFEAYSNGVNDFVENVRLSF